ncbi:hypothetical protein GWI34_08810 [Actinomadura sp. DSM 109109]|nr:hypothetical protein [Actinomadura lepetitiana]
MAFTPEVLPAAVRAIGSAPSRQRPIVMITTAADGRPQVCVPDWGELRVLGDRHLRVAVWPSDPTAACLDRGAPVLLVVPDLSDVYLVHATPRRLENAAMVWAHYDLAITSARLADRGTAPRLPQDSDGAVEYLTQRPPRRPRTHHRHATPHSPWARPSEPDGRADHRRAERARP